ncbi:pyridoxamine 5'-phosphate oxidase family protein [Catenulispora sp. NL8]|uniref:Pyridoxamine 5'-phosphate oxidase family protein n=1 Tax=Catenulispora pinistramenti TaxID=2705254 RepID=A0ABS5KYP2_9ACTN|nr:pyridoxamine 5'-phosphate oxidase family protein [Catenulispora pinistramenti]MBS2551178.1 pyridoxamine 5'-phosphate oxidase family protein [Catenulispora pinistramenti]
MTEPDNTGPGQSGQNLAATAKAIITANRYLTIATTDEHSTPWASPVFFAADDNGTDFYWMSSPETRHSRALTTNPQVSLLIFDSTAAPLTGDALAMAATATQISGTDPQGPHGDLARALRIYPGPPERGGRPVDISQITGDSPYRMYRATAYEWYVQCPWGQGACLAHGHRYDHRIAVDLSGTS